MKILIIIGIIWGISKISEMFKDTPEKILLRGAKKREKRMLAKYKELKNSPDSDIKRKFLPLYERELADARRDIQEIKWGKYSSCGYSGEEFADMPHRNYSSGISSKSYSSNNAASGMQETARRSDDAYQLSRKIYEEQERERQEYANRMRREKEERDRMALLEYEYQREQARLRK